MPQPTTVIPLGTAGAIPSRGRHLPAVALHRGGRTLLFDCGEGTQLQLLEAGLKRTRIEAICITHLHGDHLFGLLGLLSTLSLLGRETPLTIAGPPGIRELVYCAPGLEEGGTPYPTRFVELDAETPCQGVLETDTYTITAQPLDHRVVTVGYRYAEKDRPGHLDVDRANALGVTDYRDYRALKRGEAVTLEGGRVVQPGEVVGPSQPGRVFAYVSDTAPCAGGRALAEGADLLVHEATFLHERHDLAVERGHSTAREAAEVARDAGARRLLITHFSARYDDPAPLVAEARAVFENTDAALELKRYRLREDRE